MLEFSESDSLSTVASISLDSKHLLGTVEVQDEVLMVV